VEAVVCNSSGENKIHLLMKNKIQNSKKFLQTTKIMPGNIAVNFKHKHAM